MTALGLRPDASIPECGIHADVPDETATTSGWTAEII
jgi:hypothetical protein